MKTQTDKTQLLLAKCSPTSIRNKSDLRLTTWLPSFNKRGLARYSQQIWSKRKTSPEHWRSKSATKNSPNKCSRSSSTRMHPRRSHRLKSDKQQNKRHLRRNTTTRMAEAQLKTEVFPIACYTQLTLTTSTVSGEDLPQWPGVKLQGLLCLSALRDRLPPSRFSHANQSKSQTSRVLQRWKELWSNEKRLKIGRAVYNQENALTSAQTVGVNSDRKTTSVAAVARSVNE